MHLPVLALLLCLDVLYARSANSKLLRDLEMMPSLVSYRAAMALHTKHLTSLSSSSFAS